MSKKDYTLKEIYDDFSSFEKQYNDIINDTKSFEEIGENNFYLQLKFVKYLREYKQALEKMPYFRDSSESIIEGMLSEVKNVSFDNLTVNENMDKNVKYDFEERIMFFNKDSSEQEVSDDIVYHLTKIVFKDFAIIDIKNNKEYKQLNWLRNSYISLKLKNLKNNNNSEIDCETEKFSEEYKIYDTLIEIMGEEKILGLNSSNLYEVISEAIVLLKKKDISENSYNGILMYLNNIEETIEHKKLLIAEDIKEPTSKAKDEIEFFIDVLNKMEEFPESLKQQMVINLYRGVKEIEEDKIFSKSSGCYFSYLKKLSL